VKNNATDKEAISFNVGKEYHRFLDYPLAAARVLTVPLVVGYAAFNYLRKRNKEG